MLDSQGGEGIPRWLESDWTLATDDSVHDRRPLPLDHGKWMNASVRPSTSHATLKSLSSSGFFYQRVVQQTRFGS